MIQVSPQSPPCWISSIVRLPMFYAPGTELFGEMAAETNELYGENSYSVITQGRNLVIPNGLTKYKIEFNCQGNIFDVIGLSNTPFDPFAINSRENGDIHFFPIFIHAGRECFLFIESINDLFADTKMMTSGGSHRVISPMGLLNGIDTITYPGKLGDIYDARYSRIQRRDTLLNIMMMELSSDACPSFAQESLETSYGIPDGVIPLEVQLLSNVRTVGDLRRFLNPMGQAPSDIASIAMYQNYSKINEIMQRPYVLPDRVGDIHMTEAEDYSYTGAWLSGIYTQPFNDFQFQLRMDERDVSDLYARRCHVHDGFRHSFERITDWKSITDYLVLSFSTNNGVNGLLRFNNGEHTITVQRSWLEDLVLRDEKDNICLYVDMVLWMLACADGLINEDNLNQIVGYCH